MRPISLVLSSFLSVLVALTVPAQAKDTDMITVTGEIGYRERSALWPESVATITLSDVSRQDVAAPVIAQIEFAISGVPAPFELKIPKTSMATGHSYALRATIHDSDGTLRWTTDTVYPVDPLQRRADLGLLTLRQVAATRLHLVGGEWLVEDINGEGVMDILQTTLVFGTDGQLSGTGGCNRYSGTYELSGDMLSIGPLASTRMACPEAISNQENRFFETIASPLRAAMDETRALILTGEAGKTLRARRR
ncbi:META domain-containing protein [Sedimentitalea todarodis]|uniref:META domain-containing protein n=1 Tax=Sedimentitalea todarodis TaxID=1631240 RepID=A0ABU3VCB4_9RHOB|nr:META domain-containing protein [Sedimentitalea todarodis]MDU9003670.1 META domain-containing protein [Sedimentitalea todarodis]